MIKWKHLFGKERLSVLGMIHVPALPGTPLYGGSFNEVVEKSCREAEIYSSCNIDGVIVENMHDLPYVQASKMEPEITASLTRVCSEVRKILDATIKCGVQVLACGNKEALAVAQAAGLQFIRAEGFVFSHVADEGFTDACAGSLLRYRKLLGADNILIFSDIKKKHCSHSLTSDISIEETAKAADFFLSDGVIVTGNATGCPASVQDLKNVKSATSLPVLVGSGVTVNNLKDYASADGVIVGSYFKKNGRWEDRLDKDKILKFTEEVSKLKENVT